MDEGKVQVDIGLGEEIVSKFDDLSQAVLPRWRGALDDVHSGLDWMMGLGALGVGLFAASQLLHAAYWWADHGKGGDGRKAARWKQLAALSVGSAVVGGLCYVGMLATRGRMLRARDSVAASSSTAA